MCIIAIDRAVCSNIQCLVVLAVVKCSRLSRRLRRWRLTQNNTDSVKIKRVEGGYMRTSFWCPIKVRLFVYRRHGWLICGRTSYMCVCVCWSFHQMIGALETVSRLCAIGLELEEDAFSSLMHEGPHLLAPTGERFERTRWEKQNSSDLLVAKSRDCSRVPRTTTLPLSPGKSRDPYRR